MKTRILLWAFVALGMALLLQVLGSYLSGILLAVALHRYLQMRKDLSRAS